MRVSLLLPSFCRAPLLELGLFSITKNPTIHELEILVLNDGQEDDTEAVCKKFPSLNIRYIFTGQRNKNGIIKRVPGFALNIGFKQCSHDIVILSCPEMFHLNRAIDILVENLVKTPLSMVIPDFIYFDKSQVTTNSLLNNRENSIDVDTLVGRPFGACHVEMPFLMAFYKSHALEIGGYDERMIGYAGEDSDFIERLKLKGLRHLRTQAQAIHLWHGNSSDGNYHFENPDWVINWNIYQNNVKNKTIEVNVGKDWGRLEI